MAERFTKRLESGEGVAVIATYGEPPYLVVTEDFVNRLAEYEDLEENGRLIRLPCKVGDTLYDIYEAVNNQGFEDDVIKELKVSKIHINLDKRNKPWLIINNYMFAFEDFGKTVFLSKEEAEKHLTDKPKKYIM